MQAVTAADAASDATAPITVLFVDDDPAYLDFVETALAELDRIRVVSETDPRDALERIDAVDCVVSDLEMPHLDGLELLDVVRERAPSLPFVLHASAPTDAIDAIYEVPLTAYVEKDRGPTVVDRLQRRITDLVTRVRLARAEGRLRAALDACRDPVLIVDDDGSVAYANHNFVSAVASADRDCVGRPWTELFTDESVDRLRTEAIPMGSEGWNWTGRTTLAAPAGEPITARTDLVRLDDGGFVCTFHDLADD